MSDNHTLEELCEEYSVCYEIENHEKVSSIGSQLCNKLVELLDERLEDVGIENNERLINFVGDLCEQIRLRSRVALVYKDVIDFVRMKVSSEFPLIRRSYQLAQTNNIHN